MGQFLAWCEARGLGLEAVSPLHVAAYIRTHPGSAPTVKQHLAAIRMLCDWLVVSQVLPANQASAVRVLAAYRRPDGDQLAPRPGLSLQHIHAISHAFGRLSAPCMTTRRVALATFLGRNAFASDASSNIFVAFFAPFLMR